MERFLARYRPLITAVLSGFDRLVFRGLVIARREVSARKEDKKIAADLWAEKFASGELAHPGLDDRVKQLVVRIALARRAAARSSSRRGARPR